MAYYASKVVAQAKAWIGKKESNGTHRDIIDIYNTYKPHPRGYKMTYEAPWCATTVSAIAIKLGYTDIIPVECSCSKMIELAKKMGSWVESDGRTPKPGDIIMYDWDDNGKGDNTGSPDHVGIVEKVVNTKITVIEGNYSNAVKRRYLEVNGKYIRGYIVPKYDAEPKKTSNKATSTKKPAVKKSTKVKEWQEAAIKDGFKFPIYGADNSWGSECESVAKKAICKYRGIVYKYKNLTKIVQKTVGVTVDGKFGKNTKKAVITYQNKNGLIADGEVGIKTWKKILGVK